MKFFRVADPGEVKKIMSGVLSPPGTETVPLDELPGRISAETVFSPENLPDYDRSTVDGYAVRAKETYGASESIPALLRLAGAVEMGRVGMSPVKRGETVRVPTGGEVPAGTDAVVPLEYCAETGEDVAVYKPAAVGENVIGAGDDIEKGSVVLAPGDHITVEKIGVLAALGVTGAEVYGKRKVAVISTGDELVEVSAEKHKGGIRDVNMHVICALCRENNCEVVYKTMVTDDLGLLEDAVREALERADVVFVSGGSSVGRKDFTERVFSEHGRVLVHGVALKPGKPTIVAEAPGGKMLVGLPGNPAACLLVMRLLVLPAVCGKTPDAFVFARTAANFPSSPGRLTVQPVSLEFGDEDVLASPVFYKSGYVGTMDAADGYVLIPGNAEGVNVGERVKVYLPGR